MIRVVLVDDEPPARRKLRHLLSGEADFTIAGEAASGSEALQILKEQQPDALFLDIQLPDCTGFDVVAALEERARLKIVFVTAYDDFALKAFEVHAVDYLLKPVEPSRFAGTLQRLRQANESGNPRETAGRINDLMAAYSRRLLIQEAGRTIFLDVQRIDWVESARNYACIHSGAHTYIVRSTLDALASKLDPTVFRRINRSEIVNASRIAEIRSGLHGDQKVRLRGGTELTWSRRYRSGPLDELARSLGER
ncbi:MAG TPA: response regulator [Bryobacteraceae bacterium]|jgi:two-component system LytT family response regulator